MIIIKQIHTTGTVQSIFKYVYLNTSSSTHVIAYM